MNNLYRYGIDYVIGTTIYSRKQDLTIEFE